MPDSAIQTHFINHFRNANNFEIQGSLLLTDFSLRKEGWLTFRQNLNKTNDTCDI